MEGQLSKKQNIVVQLLKDGLSIKRYCAGTFNFTINCA